MATLAELLERLQQPIPDSLISQKTLKGNRIDYVAWFDLCDLLDERCGLDGWEWQIKDVQQVGNRLTLTGVLTIHGSDRSLTREATGCEDIDVPGYGDPSSNSEAMALRRACSKFGMGRDLWRKDSKPQPQRQTKESQMPQRKLQTGELTRAQWLAKFGNR